MALNAMFGEIDKFLQSYPGSKIATKSQSKRYITESFYTQEWLVNYIVTEIALYLRKQPRGLNAKEWRLIKPRVERIANQAYTKRMSVNYLKGKYAAAGFQVLASTLKKDTSTGVEFPADSRYDETVDNQVTIHARGRDFMVRFYRGFTMYQTHDPDSKIVRDTLKMIMGETANSLHADAKKYANVYQDSAGTDASEHFNTTKGTRRFIPVRLAQHQRHHAVTKAQANNRGFAGSDAGERNDSTARLVDFLEQAFDPLMKGSITAKPGSSKALALDKVQHDINTAFNSAYKLKGFDKIDIFDRTGGGQVALKSLIITIAIGHQDKKALAKYADKGTGMNDSGLDGFFQDLYTKLAKGYNPTEKGSLSLLEMSERGVFAKVAKTMKTKSGMPDMRFKVNKKLYADAKYKLKQESKARGVSGKRGKAKTTVLKGAALRKAKYGGGKGHQKFRTENNPLALEALLNDALPKVVASKMTSPALNYRTGRFANSAEVTDVMVGPRGGLAVNYTYMRDPYETFEPGNAQGSVQRDPRKIIGESVRQIAQSIIGDRFLRVRRV